MFWWTKSSLLLWLVCKTFWMWTFVIFYHTCFGWNLWGCKCPVYLCWEFSRDSFHGLELDSIWPCQVLCICSEFSAVYWLTSTRKAEISWKEFWKYKVSPLYHHARHSWDSAAVSYTLDYWRSWDDAAYLCMNSSFYPHLSYHLVKRRSRKQVSQDVECFH